MSLRSAIRRWWSAQIAHRIAASAAALIAALVALLAGLAYIHARALLLDKAEARLAGQTELLANRLSLLLAGHAADARALAGNTLLLNAVLDTSGRASYLGPLLRDMRKKGRAERRVTLTDHTGAALMTSEAAEPRTLGVEAWREDVLVRGQAAVRWSDASQGRLLMAYPVRVPGNPSPEGALVLEVSVGTDFADAASALPLDVVARLKVDGSTLASADPSALGTATATYAQVRPVESLGEGAPELAVEVAMPLTAALAGLAAMTWQIVGAGLVAVVAAVVLAHLAVRRLLTPLRMLSDTAHRIGLERRFDLAVPVQGNDEIGTMGQSFNQMLLSLRDAQHNLESQVDARTAALERTRAQLDAVQRQMNDGLLVVDGNGVIESFSGAAQALFGQVPEAAVGQGVARILPDWPSMLARASAEIGEHGRFRRTTRGRRAGQAFVAEVSVSQMHFEQRPRWVVLVRDATEQRQAQERLQRSHELLEASVRQLRQHDEDMAQIQAMNELLASCRTAAEAHVVIGQSLARLLAGHDGALAVQRDAAGFEVVAQWGEQPPATGVVGVADCWALRLGRLHVGGASAAPACTHAGPGADRVLCLPLLAQGETLGLLMLRPAPGASPEALHRIEALHNVCGEAVKSGLANVRLREALQHAAMRDQLTGLHNRRYLEDVAPRELQRAKRSGRPVALALLDLDHFKRFNDGFGHEAGDLVLRETARVLRDELRSSDIVCRVGGEELVALLPEASAAEATQRLDTVRAALAALALTHEGRPLPAVTASIGIAQAPLHGTELGVLLRAADEALYQAKAGGRDRVVSAPLAPVREAPRSAA